MKPIKSIDDPRFVKAMSHPLRVRILALLDERTASPVEICQVLGGRSTLPSIVLRSAIPRTNSKNCVACTIEYGRPDSRISFSWAIFARK